MNDIWKTIINGHQMPRWTAKKGTNEWCSFKFTSDDISKVIHESVTESQASMLCLSRDGRQVKVEAVYDEGKWRARIDCAPLDAWFATQPVFVQGRLDLLELGEQIYQSNRLECRKRLQIERVEGSTDGSTRLTHKPSPEAQGYLYFIQLDDDKRLVKIGFSRNVVKRWATGFVTDNPYPIKVICVCREATPRIERVLHDFFKDYRYRGEWFFPAEEIMEFAAKMNGIAIRRCKKFIKRVT